MSLPLYFSASVNRELDAIDPAHLSEAIDADIEGWLDEDAWREVEDRVERQRKLL